MTDSTRNHRFNASRRRLLQAGAGASARRGSSPGRHRLAPSPASPVLLLSLAARRPEAEPLLSTFQNLTKPCRALYVFVMRC